MFKENSPRNVTFTDYLPKPQEFDHHPDYTGVLAKDNPFIKRSGIAGRLERGNKDVQNIFQNNSSQFFCSTIPIRGYCKIN